MKTTGLSFYISKMKEWTKMVQFIRPFLCTTTTTRSAFSADFLAVFGDHTFISSHLPPAHKNAHSDDIQFGIREGGAWETRMAESNTEALSLSANMFTHHNDSLVKVTRHQSQVKVTHR